GPPAGAMDLADRLRVGGFEEEPIVAFNLCRAASRCRCGERSCCQVKIRRVEFGHQIGLSEDAVERRQPFLTVDGFRLGSAKRASTRGGSVQYKPRDLVRFF